MDLLIAQITTDLRSSDALRQSSALLQALQQCAAGRDVSALARTAATEILCAAAAKTQTSRQPTPKTPELLLPQSLRDHQNNLHRRRR
jgi:hypothetical protein